MPLLRIFLTASLLTLLAFNTGCTSPSQAADRLVSDANSKGNPCAYNDTECNINSARGTALDAALIDAPSRLIDTMGSAARAKSWERNLDIITSNDHVICDDDGNCREVEAIDETQPAFTVLDEATE